MSRLRSCLLAAWLVPAVAGSLFGQPSAPGAVQPPMPKGKSPVDFFRRLIVATPEETEKLLGARDPVQRKAIEDKVVEYRLLPPPLREWRLKATELRWYLVPLMRLPPGGRATLLQTVPDEDRPLVDARLQQWDLLPPGEQEILLNNELALRYVARPNSAPAPSPEELSALPTAARGKLEQAVAQWREMPEGRRRELTDRFARFFALNERDQNRTLDLLTAGEREQLRQTIDSFANLPPADREHCLQGMRQFSSMSREERASFLRGAERWKNLTEEQRKAWRALVTQLPPTPPGALMPPLPPGFKEKALPPGASAVPVPAPQALATNSF